MVKKRRPEDDWAIRLGFYIHDTSRLRKLFFDSAFRPTGVTRAQASLLSYLWDHDALTQSELAARVALGKVAVGSLIDKLEAAGMVERLTDPDDRRAKRVALTTRGRHALGRLRELGARANERALTGISDRDIATTAKTLKRMKKNLIEALDDDTGA